MKHLLKLLKFITGLSAIVFSSIETKIWWKCYNCGHIVHDERKCQKDDRLLPPSFSHRNTIAVKYQTLLIWIFIWNFNVVVIMMQKGAVKIKREVLKCMPSWRMSGLLTWCDCGCERARNSGRHLENVRIIDLMWLWKAIFSKTAVKEINTEVILVITEEIAHWRREVNIIYFLL